MNDEVGVRDVERSGQHGRSGVGDAFRAHVEGDGLGHVAAVDALYGLLDEHLVAWVCGGEVGDGDGVFTEEDGLEEGVDWGGAFVVGGEGVLVEEGELAGEVQFGAEGECGRVGGVGEDGLAE